MVIHDPDLKRVFGIDLSIGDVTRDELKLRCPAIPSLPDVIEKYGKKLVNCTEGGNLELFERHPLSEFIDSNV